MADIAALGFSVDSSSLKTATTALDSLARSAVPAEQAVAKLGATSDRARNPLMGMGQGLSSAAQATNVLTGNFDRATAAQNRMTASGEKSAQVIALQGYQLRNLGMQANDAATMILSGSSAFQVMATQGGQVAQVLQGANGGVSAGLKQVGAGILGMITPARVAMAAVAGIGVAGYAAWAAWDDKIKATQIAVNGLGRGVGLTSAEIVRLGEVSAKGNSLSISQGIAGATTFAGAGIYGSNIPGLNRASRQFAGAFGVPLDEAQGSLAGAMSDPAKGIRDLGKSLGQFSLETEREVIRLQSLGKLQEAQALLLKALNERLQGTTDVTSAFAKTVENLKDGFDWLATRFGKAITGVAATDPVSAAQRAYQVGIGLGDSPEELKKLADAVLAAQIRAGEAGKKAAEAQANAERERQKRIEEDNRRITSLGANQAEGILARTSSEKLAVEQSRLRTEATFDTSRAVTLAAEAERARTIAIAEATRALRDHQKALRDEFALSGDLTEGERIRIRTQQEFREIRNKTDVLGGGASLPGAAGGVTGLAGEFQSKLAALVAAIPGITITSGFRSNDRQAQLYAAAVEKYGSEEAARKWVAPPGSSMHNRGLAADLAFPNDEARRRAHQMAGEFGLNFPMGHEPWHVEPIGARGSRLANDNGPRPLTIGGGKNYSEDETISIRQMKAFEASLGGSRRALELNNAQLDANIASFGKSTEAVATATEKTRLENEARQLLGPNIESVTDKINAQAEAQGKYAAKLEATQLAQTRYIGDMDMMRSGLQDMISSPLKALAQGKNAGEAFRQSLANLGSKLIDRGANSLTEMLLGGQGKAGGGLLGGLFGGAMSAANMNVQAGNVIVSGGIGGIGGGASGGGGSWLSQIFGGGGGGFVPTGQGGGLYANGGVMTPHGDLPLRKYAAGGIANSAQVSIFGEGSTPEAYVPLQDGRTIPVKIQAGVKSIASGAEARNGPANVNYHGGDLIIQGNAGKDELPLIQSMLEKNNRELIRHMQRNAGTMQQTYNKRYG